VLQLAILQSSTCKLKAAQTVQRRESSAWLDEVDGTIAIVNDAIASY
jgi:hypothetical protein